MNEIEELIEDALKETSNLVLKKETTSRIIIPLYRALEEGDESIRYSEQELKEIFISKVGDNSSFYYSVETPSEFVYSISNSKEPTIKKLKEKDDHHESARIDVSIYSDESPKSLISHIEFKHGNPSDTNEIAKDFLRLSYEFGRGNLNFFVHYVVRGSSKWKSETFPSIMKKYYDASMISSINKVNLDKVIVYLMFVEIDKNKKTVILKFNLESLTKNFKEKQKFEERELKWMEIKTSDR